MPSLPAPQPPSPSHPPSAETLDCTGLLCPLPIYKTSMALKRLAAGEVLKIVCTDPGALEDLPAFSRRTGHRLIAVEESGETQTFWLEKA